MLGCLVFIPRVREPLEVYSKRQLHDLWCVLNMFSDAGGVEVSGGRLGEKDLLGQTYSSGHCRAASDLLGLGAR